MKNDKKNLSSIINKGLLVVYVPMVSFIVVCVFLSKWIATDILKSDIIDFIEIITFLFSLIIGWIWWSYKVVKWKYWAFSQLTIDEAYELYSKAINVGLIWPTGSAFNKTEIWTKEDKRKWSKFNSEIKEIFE